MNLVRKHRLARMWTQAELAKASGVHARTISGIEAGRPVQQSTKRKILKAFGFDFSEKAELFPPEDDE